MRKGFTLVELSIVLVIIGLLIAGLLVAQSMVGTAKLEMTIKQLSQYDAAIANFITKYNQVPGDSNLFNPVGNNNKTTTDNLGEEGYSWSDLSLGVGFMNPQGGPFIGFNAGLSPTAAGCPTLAIPQNPNSGYNCANIEYPTQSWQTPRYRFHSGSVGSHPTDDQLPLRSIDAYELDKKIDDGYADTGYISTYEWGTTPNGAICGGHSYAVSNPAYACIPFITIGIATGINQ